MLGGSVAPCPGTLHCVVPYLGGWIAQDALLEVEEGEVARRAQVSGQFNFASDPISCGARGRPGWIGTQVEPLPLHSRNPLTGLGNRLEGLVGYGRQPGIYLPMSPDVALPQLTLDSKTL